MTDELLTPTASQGTTLLTNVTRRTTRSLDGPWQVILDPYDTGYVDILGQRNRQGYFRDFTPRSPSDRVEYDFDTSRTLEVPGDWNTQAEDLLHYEGTVWYRRRIDIETAPTGRRFLHFGAVNHTARVFLDGEELATHVGGFGPFSVEVTDRLGPGPHSLVVQANNRREPTRVPAMRFDWWNFGGITRSVEVVDVPTTFLRDAWITMAEDGRLVGGVVLDGPAAATAEAAVELPGAGLTIPAGSDGRIEVPAETAAGLDRWHPGRPVLHDLRWSLS
ncbi:MAG: sugar-binding domain-containing protein, partial [Actinomycetota bacterium]